MGKPEVTPDLINDQQGEMNQMIRRIQKQLGTAGLVVAVTALVVALAGTAFAAKAVFTKKQEKQIVKIAKKYAGKDGKNGATGPQGAKGDQGPKGDAGPKGEQGSDGKAGEQGQDGEIGETGEAGICSTANPECQLPTGATLVGAWGTSGGQGASAEDISLVSISFNQLVSPAPAAAYELFPGFGVELKDGESVAYGPFPNPGEPSEEQADAEAFQEDCPGSADEPKAAPGVLCIYQGATEGFPTRPGFIPPSAIYEAANEFGMVVPFKLGSEQSARGSWAVTAS